MATVTLTRDQCREDALPMVCAKCGQRAAVHVPRTFTWYPPWVWALLAPGVVPGLILMFLKVQRATVPVPFCDRHVRHWATPTTIGFVGIPLCLAAAVLSATLPLTLEDRSVALNVSMMTLFVFTVVVGLWHGKLIRPERITADAIVLGNVSPAFAVVATVARPAPQRAYGDFDDDDGPRPNRYDVDE